MLDTLLNTIQTTLGPLGPVIIIGALGLVLILGALSFLLKREADPLSKLKDQAKRDAQRISTAPSLRHQDKAGDKLNKYADFLEPQSEEEFSAVRLKLMQAGYYSKNAVRTFHFMQFALGLSGLAIGAVYALFRATVADPSTEASIMMVMIPGGVGYMLPKYWVTKRQQTRQEEITNGFPDALDLMLVCVEAGQSLDQSINRVSIEMRSGAPALAHEFETVAYEMKAGKDKIYVLKDLAERAGVVDISSFVTVLIQSATFGTSIAEALRVFSAEMRDKRVMRAEEKANTLPTKMTLATMMLTVPPLLIIMIGPSVHGVMTMMNSGAL